MKSYKKVFKTHLGLVVVMLGLLFGAGLLLAQVPPAPLGVSSLSPPAPLSPSSLPPPAPLSIVEPPPPPPPPPTTPSCVDDGETGDGTCETSLSDSCCEFLTCVDSDPQEGLFTCYLSPPPPPGNGNGNKGGNKDKILQN